MTDTDVKKMGLFSCAAVVAGNMMGSGIALLPANLAALGSIALWGWIIACLGALALAYVYARLGAIDPQEGGPIAYSGEVSPILGYQAGLLYFHAGWIGNLAVAIAGVDYLSVFFPVLTQPIASGITTIVVLWVFTALNLLGAAWIGRLVTVGVIALLIPVVLTGTLGWLYFDPKIFFDSWNVSSQPSAHAILAAVVLCIWSFIGIESASVNAGLVENPKRNIPLATFIGTTLAALVYVSSCTAISGMFPAAEVAKSGAPFSMALGHIVQNMAPAASAASWTKITQDLVSAVTAFACLMSLGSWIMMIAQAAVRASNDGTLPPIFAKKNDREIPVQAIVLTSAMATVLMLVMMAVSGGGSTQGVFGEIASITVLFTIIPYFYSALQLMKLGCVARQKAVGQILISILASAFCLTALAGAQYGTLVAAVLFIFGLLIFYATKDRTEFEDRMRALRHDPAAAGEA